MTTNGPTPEPERLTFDQEVMVSFKEAADKAFLRPEVRSLAVLVDYQSGLNNSGVMNGLWLEPSGPVQSIDAIIGSLEVTLSLLKNQVNRAVQVGTKLIRELEDLDRKSKEGCHE